MYKTHQPHFWKLRCRKSARRCGAKHISKSEVQETAGHGALLDVQMPFRVAGARDCAPDGRRGTFEEDLQRCISRGRRSTKDMFMRDVRRSGCWFHEKGCILEYQILRWTTTRLCTPIFTRLYTHENHDHDHGDHHHHHHHHHHQGVSCNLQGCRSLAPARWRLPDRPRVVSSAPRPRTSARPGAVTWPLPAGRAWHPDVRHDIGWCLHFCFVRSSWRPDLIPPWSACCFGHPHPSRRPTRMSTGTSSLDWRWPGAANGEPWARPLWSVGGLVLLLSALPACGSGHFRSYVGVAVGFIGLRGGPRWPGAAACTDIVGMLASASARLLILGQPLARPSAANGPQWPLMEALLPVSALPPRAGTAGSCVLCRTARPVLSGRVVGLPTQQCGRIWKTMPLVHLTERFQLPIAAQHQLDLCSVCGGLVASLFHGAHPRCRPAARQTAAPAAVAGVLASGPYLNAVFAERTLADVNWEWRSGFEAAKSKGKRKKQKTKNKNAFCFRLCCLRLCVWEGGRAVNKFRD